MSNKLKNKTWLSTKQIKSLYNIVRIVGIDELDDIPKMLKKEKNSSFNGKKNKKTW